MADALVHVGMPTHGRPVFVREAVESVVAQTFEDWRLVISEDGPGSDEVRDAVAPYLDDERISYGPTGERLAAPRHMSRLLQEGGSPYVILLHDDDCWQPEVLERRVRFLEEHPECGFVFSGHFDIDGAGRRIGDADFPLPEGVCQPETLAPMMLRANVMDIMASVLVRRPVWEAIGQEFNESFPRIFDWEMWARLAVESPGGFLAVRDVAYRRHDQQISSHAGEAEEFLRLYDHIDGLLASRRPELRPSARERASRRSSLMLSSALDALDADDRAGARRALRGALSISGRAALNPRFLLAALATLGGRPARALLRAGRRARYQRSARPD